MYKRKIRIFGDSILKGIQFDNQKLRYVVNENIGLHSICDETGLEEKNISKFGCTVLKADQMIDRILERDDKFDFMLMDFGGNDCDFDWAAVSKYPDDEHLPNCPPEEYARTYRRLITKIREHGIIPVITSLPPVISQRYLDWNCQSGLVKENIIKWLGGVDTIGTFQAQYSDAAAEIAKTENVRFIDIRKPFENLVDQGSYYCLDGIHPNSKGQALIGKVLREYAKNAS